MKSLIDNLQRSDMNSQSYDAAIKLGEMRVDEETRRRIVEALIGALSHVNPLTRAHAAESLGKLGSKEATPALMSMLKDPYRLVRSYSARALGQIGQESAIDPLVVTLKNDDFFGVRAEAAEALGRICADSTTAPCKNVPKILMEQMKIEEGRGDERRRRVLAEVALALTRNQVENVLGYQLNALEEGKPLELDEGAVKRYERGLAGMEPKLKETEDAVREREEKEAGTGLKGVFGGIREAIRKLRAFGETIDSLHEQKDRLQFILSTARLLFSVVALLSAPPVGMVALSLQLVDAIGKW